MRGSFPAHDRDDDGTRDEGRSWGHAQPVRDVLHAPLFVDVAPAEVVATLLDEGVYLASERTMYRILAEAGQTGERRNQLTHPRHARPELLATQPNELWSWDIERHEALLDRAVMEGHRRRPVAAGWLKLRAA